MTKIRTPVPKAISDAVMHANKHTCCVCRAARLPVEAHHINEDPSDHRHENLAVLCRNCHGLVHQKGPLSRHISAGEVRISKREWEARCGSEGELDEPTDDDHDVVNVRSDENYAWTYQLSAGDTMVVGIDSDVAVTAMIARESDYRRWLNGEDTGILEQAEDVYQTTLELEAANDNRYAIWVTNEEEEDAVVEVDIAIWPSQEEDEDEE